MDKFGKSAGGDDKDGLSPEEIDPVYADEGIGDYE